MTDSPGFTRRRAAHIAADAAAEQLRAALAVHGVPAETLAELRGVVHDTLHGPTPYVSVGRFRADIVLTIASALCARAPRAGARWKEGGTGPGVLDPGPPREFRRPS